MKQIESSDTKEVGDSQSPIAPKPVPPKGDEASHSAKKESSPQKTPPKTQPSQKDKKVTKAHFTKQGSIITDNKSSLKWQDGDIQWGDFDEANTICKNLVLDGESGWRVPTERELLSLLDLSHTPKIDPLFRAKTDEEFWSSTPYMADASNSAYYVDFSTGWSYMYDDRSLFNKSRKRAVRCVKGKPLSKDHFVKKGETILDTTTHLMWQNDHTLQENTLSVKDAVEYCRNLKLTGFNDWRLPTINELFTITDRSHYDPAIDKNFDYLPTFEQDEKHFSEGNYWSSSYCGTNHDNPSIHYYRTLNIQNGASHRCRSYMQMYERGKVGLQRIRPL